MDDHPRRKRRSSISEHFQRVFSVDRSDKKRPSNGLSSGKRDAALVPNSETTIGFEAGTTTTNGTVETGPSSYTHSTRPSVSTAGSSPPVHPVRIKDDDSKQAPSNMKAPTTQTHDTTATTSTADIDRICSSPTWAKDVNRKERRATKRLEAERKELEKRLSNLEDAQLKLEQGIFDRNSRRLTKKQPLDSSKRSSSANTERPRSSSFTSLFSSKRRSRSRASSMNGSDRNSRTSSEFGGPPTLPLSLTERFGTAVSRELATRHGTSLVPSHQMPRTLHHTTGKSDDLRENWKMAEEWKKRNGGVEPEHAMSMTTMSAHNVNALSMSKKPDTTKRHTLTETYAHRKIEPSSNPPSQPTPQATELSADLDRDSFTAALRNERKPPGVASRTPNSSTPSGNSSTRNKGSKVTTQSENRPPNTPDAPITGTAPAAPTAAAIAARQMNGISHVHPHSAQIQSSPKPMAYFIPTATSASKPGGLPKVRVDANPKAYKSSPLALNPFTNKDVERKNRRSSKSVDQQIDHSNAVQPSSPEGQRGFSREIENDRPAQRMTTHPVAPDKHTPTNSPPQRPTKERIREGKAAEMTSPDSKSEHMPSDANMPPLMVPPLKHSRRRQATESPARSMQEMQETPAIVVKKPDPVEQSVPDPPPKPQSKPESPRRVSQLADGGHGHASEKNEPNVQRPGHSRTSSCSSYGGSSYDTADEEVLDISKAHTRVKPPQPSPPQEPVPEPSPHRAKNPHNLPLTKGNQEFRQNATTAITQHSPGGNPPLASDGPISMIRQIPVQRTKKPQKDQVLAKIFVICCSCKYWHDMPSEIYARLACPERLPTESRLMRTFSRKGSSHRRNSLFDSTRGLPSQLRVQSPPKQENGTDLNGGGGVTQGSQFSPIPCNWCGHGMTRSCCQGWTTLVQMRDRHH
ncbi:hypothetical protein PENSTE_c002G01375 [Penicillium steckii]|uniref:Uncharacterized protein n=1 Tax=Penicillium steckii TaxID=303698 RepID=A0A1V6TVD0_9EURO|nr:hypothetical protein PENSTE_c002G01375 [Penicillium steckii]